MKKLPTMIKGLALLLASGAVAPLAFAGGPHAPDAPELVPGISNPGECYARIEIPAQYSKGSEGIMVEEGYTSVEVQQPQLSARQAQIMVKEPSVRYHVRQPTYHSVSEQIMVRPAYDKLHVTPPKFSTITESVQTSAPRLVWKRGNPGKLAAQGYTIHSTASGGGYNQSSGDMSVYQTMGATPCGPNCEIWCLVEEPGEVASFRRKVMTAPTRVERRTVPAKYHTLHKQVVADPGGVEQIVVPAEYRSIMVEEIADPGGSREVHIPPKYASVGTKTLIAPARYEWRRVLCNPGTGTIGGSGTYGAPSQSGYSYNSNGAYKSNAVDIYSTGGANRTTPDYAKAHHQGHNQSKRKRKRWY